MGTTQTSDIKTIIGNKHLLEENEIRSINIKIENSPYEDWQIIKK